MNCIPVVRFLKITDVFFSVWAGVRFSSEKVVDLMLNMVLYVTLTRNGCRDITDGVPSCERTKGCKCILLRCLVCIINETPEKTITNVVLLKEIYWQKSPFSACCISKPTVAGNVVPNSRLRSEPYAHRKRTTYVTSSGHSRLSPCNNSRISIAYLEFLPPTNLKRMRGKRSFTHAMSPVLNASSRIR